MTVEVIDDKFPVRKDSIEELVGHRNRSLEMAKQAFILLGESEKAAALAAPTEPGNGWLSSVEIRGRRYWVDGDDLKAVRRAVDESAWRSLLRISGLRNLMDATAHEKFSNDLSKEPPEFTIENVTAAFMQAAIDAPQILERSIVAVFDRLNTKRYKTNSAFGIGPRCILTSALSQWGGWNSYGFSFNLVNDMDRLFHVLDGKKPPEAGSAADLIGREHQRKAKTCKTEYFEAKMFRGNGNLHLKFTRPDLVVKVNRILTKHYGATLPDDRKSA